MIYLLYQNPSSLPNVSLDGLLLWMKKVAALNANLDLMALAHHPDMNAIGCIWVYKAKLNKMAPWNVSKLSWWLRGLAKLMVSIF